MGKQYGLIAEFESPGKLIEAAEKVRSEGYSRIDAFTPFPVEGLSEALGFKRNPMLSAIVLICGVLGGFAGYLMQYFGAMDYPLNAGGRPFHAWPAFIPITFEMIILGAALGAVIGMLIMNGLPKFYHPVFNVSRFGLASESRFFLIIETKDPKFDQKKTKVLLESLKPHGVYDVDR